MLRPTSWIIAALTVVSIAASSTVRANAAAPSRSASATIDYLDTGLLDIMQRSDELGLEGRANSITPVIEECFDLPSMARATIGRVWTDLSGDERQRWVKAFSTYIIYKLADQFDRFSGQSFEIVGERPASSGTLIVQTRLRRPAKDDVRLDYRMRENESGWKVIDIYAKGMVSEVALRSSEYRGILRKGGIDLLIELVSAQKK